MTTKDKLAALRKEMKKEGFAAYIIPPADPHQSEYIPDHWKSRQWFSGFTGSAGTVVVTHYFAGLWTDSRYFIQAEEELKGSDIELVKLQTPNAPEYIDWLAENLKKGDLLGIDGKIFAQSLVESLKTRLLPRGIKINCAFDLPGRLWEDRPPMSLNKVYEHEQKFAGKTRSQKLALVRQQMSKQSVDHQLLTALDDIAWLFNLRGTDVEYNPVFIAWALVSKDSTYLFIDQKKLPEAIKSDLEKDEIEILDYDAITQQLGSLGLDETILLSESKTSHHIYLSIAPQCRKKNGISIPTEIKACKDEGEVKNIKHAMARDGAALVKFFRWLENNIGKEEITEITIDQKLTTLRAEQPGYKGNSFGTIAGYKDHGAIVHYSATPHTAHTLKPEGLLLLDSGAQYVDGTTDITRTISLGKPTEEEMVNYTLVLKGLIHLSQAIFPEGTKGFHLDAIARSPLWEKGRNYGHGTGHGVGYFLNVHEGPQGITPNPAANYPLLPGMIQSNEPGYYKEGHYGIRLENLILVKHHSETEYGRFYQFETLTLFPFEKNLIDPYMLCDEERGWINRYHKKVFETLSPHLDKEDNQWLLTKTRSME